MRHYDIVCTDGDGEIRTYPVLTEKDAIQNYNIEVMSKITIRVQKKECHDPICLGERRGSKAD